MTNPFDGRVGVGVGNADIVLHDAFNDEMVHNYIITYLRVRSDVVTVISNTVTDYRLDSDKRMDKDKTS